MNWIKVEDRLPEFGVVVLIFFEDGDMYTAKTFGGEWIDIDGADFSYGFAVPTHWMELPPPPNQD